MCTPGDRGTNCAGAPQPIECTGAICSQIGRTAACCSLVGGVLPPVLWGRAGPPPQGSMEKKVSIELVCGLKKGPLIYDTSITRENMKTWRFNLGIWRLLYTTAFHLWNLFFKLGKYICKGLLGFFKCFKKFWWSTKNGLTTHWWVSAHSLGNTNIENNKLLLPCIPHKKMENERTQTINNWGD